MKTSTVILALLAVAASTTAAASENEESESPRYPEAKVVWETAEPTCPLTEGRMYDEIDDPDLYPFKLDGDVTEPVMISRIHDYEWTEEQLDCYRTGIGLTVYQLVINRDGRVEEIVRVRDQPECWTQAMVDILQECRFEPSSLIGEPICVAYVMTMRFHPY
jgi:hypothetical protein